MPRLSIRNGALVASTVLVVLVVARPAAGQSWEKLRNDIKEELERAENRLEKVVHDAGDSFEKRTGVDVGLADNVERGFGTIEKEWDAAARGVRDARDDIADDLEHAVTEFLEGMHEAGEDLLDRLCKLIEERAESGEAGTCASDGPAARDGDARR